MPEAGVGAPFAGWSELTGEAGGLFPTSPFGLPAGGVGSAGLGAGTLCGGVCGFICGLPPPKSRGTGVSVVTTGSFLMTSAVIVCTVGVSCSANLLSFTLIFCELESPSEPDPPSELEPRMARPPLRPSIFASLPPCLSTPIPLVPTLVVPILGIEVNGIGTPNVLTGHGGGGVMKVGSGLGSPGRIVVV